MANNRIYLRCKCGKGGVSLAKYYPPSGWFPPRPTPRERSENDGKKPALTDSDREHEYFTRVEEFFAEHSHTDQDPDGNGYLGFFIEDEFNQHLY